MSFAEQFDSAGTLSGVSPAVAKEMVRGGLIDGDLKDDILSVSQSPEKSLQLKPSQKTMVLKDVVAIALEMLQKGGGKGEPLGAFVSKDGYILDGHHAWAASILARGPSASAKVWKTKATGEDLIRVLNIVSKGQFGVSSGNSGEGSIKDLTPKGVQKWLEFYLENGRQHPKFSPSKEEVAAILENNFGSVEKGVFVLSGRAKMIPKSTPSWAPKREQMPVIKRKNVQKTVQLLNTGEVDWHPPYSDASPSRVAVRYQARKVAYEVAGGFQSRVASKEITGEVLWAFADAFWLPTAGSTRVASLRSLRGLAKRLKQLGKLFSRAPRLWEDFKKLIGVEALSDLPGALKDLAEKGKAALKKILKRTFDTFPLSIFKIKGAGVNDFLKQFTDQVPGMTELLAKVKGKADLLGEWLRKYVPNLSKILTVAIFAFIWMNVVEFEWNFSDLGQALIGKISLGELLATLPGSAIGFLMNGLGLGTFTLLPMAVLGRIVWLMHKGYVTWDGRWFQINERALNRDGLSLAR